MPCVDPKNRKENRTDRVIRRAGAFGALPLANWGESRLYAARLELCDAEAKRSGAEYTIHLPVEVTRALSAVCSRACGERDCSAWADLKGLSLDAVLVDAQFNPLIVFEHDGADHGSDDPVKAARVRDNEQIEDAAVRGAKISLLRSGVGALSIAEVADAARKILEPLAPTLRCAA